MTLQQSDEIYMKRCLQLAMHGMESVYKNPLVGAVIVNNNKIIGEGFHKKYGEAHAEINAINNVCDKNLLSSSTLYISLEPCCHFGKTPPCTNAIIENKIKTVVIGCRDYSDKVNGKGIDILKQNGVEVRENVLEKECRKLNEMFFIFHSLKRPFITLKWAQSNDGFIGKMNGSQIKISNDAADVFTHRLRAIHQAIVIGKNTLFNDNPMLDVRYWNGKNPLRIAYIGKNLLKTDLKFFRDENHLVFFDKGNTQFKINFKELNNNDNLSESLSYLYKQGIQSILVEGGAQLLQTFIDQKLYDRILVIASTIELKNGIKPPILNSKENDFFYLGNNRVSVYET